MTLFDLGFIYKQDDIQCYIVYITVDKILYRCQKQGQEKGTICC